jgi:hypothetical protein
MTMTAMAIDDQTIHLTIRRSPRSRSTEPV